MQSSAISVILNRITEIDPVYLLGFKLYTSIKEGLPYGYITVDDHYSYIMARFENLQIGASIDITLANFADNQETHKYPTFYILQLENDFSANSSRLAGTIRIWFGHAWFLYKNIKNHAYKPMNIAELIKKILKDEDRGMAFEADDDNFDETDDNGKLSRFKISETDWDFIQNKLLPYTTINKMPAHFFCNDRGEFFLKSFRNLYSENSKIIYTQNEEHLSEETNLKRIKEICEKNNINFGTHHFPVSELHLKIGNEDILKEIYPYFLFENLEDGSFLSGSKKLSNKLRNRSGSSFGNMLPIDNMLMMKTKGTSVKIIYNRQAFDVIPLLFQAARVPDNLFFLTVYTNFIGDKVSIGDTSEINITPIKYNERDERSKVHWMDGKWLNVGFEHYTDAEDVEKFLTKSYLVRPSFVGNEDSTSLSMLPLLYESP